LTPRLSFRENQRVIGLRRGLGAALIICLGAAAARAQTQSSSAEDRAAVDASEAVTAGTHFYFDTDARLTLALPYRLRADAEFNEYHSSGVTSTPIGAVGAGVDFDNGSFKASYALQGRANEFESNTIDARLDIHAGPEEYLTRFSVGVDVKHDTEHLVPFHAVFNVTQLIPSMALTQKVGPWRFSIGLTQYNYNEDPAVATGFLKPLGIDPIDPRISWAQIEGLNGLVAGFPEWSAKYGAFYDFKDLPLTLWASYLNVHMTDTVFGTNQTVDALAGGADYRLCRSLSAAAKYAHFRETSQASSSLFGLSLAGRF
jgi:hypothetical protein